MSDILFVMDLSTRVLLLALLFLDIRAQSFFENFRAYSLFDFLSQGMDGAIDVAVIISTLTTLLLLIKQGIKKDILRTYARVDLWGPVGRDLRTPLRGFLAGLLDGSTFKVLIAN